MTLNQREGVLFNLLDVTMKDINAQLEKLIPHYPRRVRALASAQFFSAQSITRRSKASPATSWSFMMNSSC